MVKFDIPDIRKDLPMSMTMAAFSGIAWYIAIELNIRLFYLFKRRKGTETDEVSQKPNSWNTGLLFSSTQAFTFGPVLCVRGGS